MKPRTTMRPLAAVLSFAFMTINAIVGFAQNAPKPVDPIANFGRLPLTFERNVGQTDPNVRFLARGRGYTLFLTPSEAVLALQRAARPAAGGAGLADPAKGSAASLQSAVVRMKLAGADAAVTVEALDPFVGRSNYFVGNDPAKWYTDLPTYARVAYRGVYPGVDVVYYGNQQQLEYDIVVAPGGDPRAILLQISRDRATLGRRQSYKSNPKIAADGDLVVPVDGGEVRLLRPVAYQISDGNGGASSRRLVPARFVVRGGDLVGIRVGAYDRAKKLIIDPVLVYSTYLGGGLRDQGYGIAVDSSGSAYITGNTNSPSFPTTAGAFKITCGSDVPATCNAAGSHGADNPNTDVFVTKLTADGSGLVYSTYLGGALQDAGRAVAVDALGNAYGTGFTNSLDFPITASAFQKSCGPVIARDNFSCMIRPPTTTCGSGGHPDAFVTKLNPTGSALVYSTYLGGSNNDVAGAIAVNVSGEAYVAGATDSEQDISQCPNSALFNQNFAFPTTANGFMAAPAPSGTAWPASGPSWGTFSKLSADGAALVYSTYIGAASGPFLAQGASGVAVDASGDGYVTGQTNGSTFPTTPGVVGPVIDLGHTAPCGGPPCADAYVQKFDPSQSGSASLIYSTFLGGSGDDRGSGIAVDSSGNAYVTGGAGFNASSPDFPTTPGAFQSTCPAPCMQIKGFVTKLNSTATALVYSSFLGGQSADTPLAITIDSQGGAYVTGPTTSTLFPVTSNAIQPSLPGGGGTHGFVTVFAPAGSGLAYSSFLGGVTNTDTPQSIAVDSSGNMYVTGTTFSTDFPTTPGAFQTTCANCGINSFFSAAFVSKISPLTVPQTLTSSPTGLSMTLSGTGCAPGTYATPANVNWNIGANCSVSFPTPQAGTPGTQYVFASSTLNGGSSSTANPRAVAAGSSPLTINASFTTQYQLTTTAGEGGTISPPSGFYSAGNVMVSATPNSGFTFSGFGGALSGTTNPQTLNLTGPATVTASFTQNTVQYQLTTQAQPPGAGTVTPLSGQFYNAGTVVPVTATPNACWAVGTWSPNVVGNQVTMSSAQTVTHTFVSSAAVNPTAQFQIVRSGFFLNRETGRYLEAVLLINKGAALTNVSLALDNLSAGVTLFQPSGVTSCASPAGSPYKNAGHIGAPGVGVLILEFTKATPSTVINYSPRVLAGPGQR